jgi:hypothetical protein
MITSLLTAFLFLLVFKNEWEFRISLSQLDFYDQTASSFLQRQKEEKFIRFLEIFKKKF